MDENNRQSRGRKKPEASFPVAGKSANLPADCQTTLTDLKQRIADERLRVTLSANAAVVILYWDIGQTILTRQDQQGRGAKIIDRLSEDLKDAFPEMSGFSPRNLRYMRKFAAEWPSREIVQEVLAQITWYHNLALLEKCKEPDALAEERKSHNEYQFDADMEAGSIDSVLVNEAKYHTR